MNNYSERRVKPRVNCNYPVIIECALGRGIKSSHNAKLVNLSATGLYMILDHNPNFNSTLSLTILLEGDCGDEESPKIIANGIIVRTEIRLDGSYGVAVKFTSYRFV